MIAAENPMADARLQALRGRMRSTQTDLIAIGPGSHMQWLLGSHPHSDERSTLLLVTQDDTALVIPETNAGPFVTNVRSFEWKDSEGPEPALTSALDQLGLTGAYSIAVDEIMRSDFTLLLLAFLPGSQLQPLAETLGRLRSVKEGWELHALRTNAQAADAVMQSAFSKLAVGITEEEVAAAVRTQFVAEDTVPRFWIIASGPNGVSPHHKTGSRKLIVGDAVVVDIGGRKMGYTSDITRMAVIGHPPKGYDDVHAVVERAVSAALAAARPGVMAKKVDAAARGVIASAGYGSYFLHRTGHGIGIDGHEAPYITGASNTILEEGMVFSIEPGIYLPGRFGVRLEEIVVLHQDGPEILSSLPRDAYLVEEG